jgi:hypothetical protein
MGPPIRLRTRLWLGGLAAGGVALAHVLAFVLAAPDPIRREQLLEATGHGAWPLLVTIATGALVAALAGFAAGRLRDNRPTSPAVLYRATVGRLMLLQMAGFLVLEAFERLGTGRGLAGVAGLPGEPVILIGLAAQVLVALAGAILVVLLARLLDQLILILRTTPRAPRVLSPRGALDVAFPRLRISSGPANPRGPPRRT